MLVGSWERKCAMAELTSKGRKLFGLFFALTICARTLAGNDPVIVFGYFDDGTDAPVSDHECMAFANCPIVIDGAPANPQGCPPNCSGRCRFCPGSAIPVAFCVFATGLTCNENASNISCGGTYSAACKLVGQPLQTCMCDTFGPIQFVSGTCNKKDC